MEVGLEGMEGREGDFDGDEGANQELVRIRVIDYRVVNGSVDEGLK